MTVAALTIAGSDPSGGAGIQADIKTFHQFGVYGMSAVTLLTVQNTQRVEQVEALSPELTIAQLDAVVRDIPPAAAKTGALGTASMIHAVAERARSFAFPLIVDPVMLSKHGDLLLEDDAQEVLRNELLPHAWLLTPNMAEAGKLVGFEIDSVDQMKKAAEQLLSMGPANVLIKGGALPEQAVDVLATAGGIQTFVGDHVNTTATHGSGCVYSAAITARVALGDDLGTAVRVAKAFITQAIVTNPKLGEGVGPVNMNATVNADA